MNSERVLHAYPEALASRRLGTGTGDLDDILFYTRVIAGLALVWLLVLLRFVCSERFGNLNLKRARWWQDVLGGLSRPLLLALRDIFRRRGRLALTVGVLAVSGATFRAALNVGASRSAIAR